LVEAVSRLTRGGARLLRKDAYALGEALESACLDALAERQGRTRGMNIEAKSVRLRIGKSEVLFLTHAIPAAASVAAVVSWSVSRFSRTINTLAIMMRFMARGSAFVRLA
jgi:hypothetical protein